VASIIHTPTNNFEQSLDFYARLGYQRLSYNNLELVSDGQVIIEINPDRFARAGVKLIKESWKNDVKDIEELVNVLSADTGYLLSDPSGTWIYLVESDTEFNPEFADTSPSVLGNYAGLSLETTSIDLSFHFWKLLGFTNQQGSIDDGWVTLRNDDDMTVSLMKPNTCPHLFFNPSLTFFNGEKNLEIISKLRELKIPITEEITHFNKEGIVDNVIIRDPGGYGFFIFSD
jgi:hypothetical protein